MLHILRISFYLLVVAGIVEPARILAFFQISSRSHHFIFRGVIEALAKRGHEVLYVTTLPYDEPPKGINQIILPRIVRNENSSLHFTELGEMTILGITKEFGDLGSRFAHIYLGEKQVQELIHSNETFDAILMESWLYQEYLSAFIHKFNAVGIELITLGDFGWENEMAGLPSNPAYQLDVYSQLTGDMNFWQRLYNTYLTLTQIVFGYYYLGQRQALMDQYFNYTGWESRPPIDVLARNRSLILNNFDVLFGHPYPMPPHRKDIGGINLKPNKPLPKDLQTFMDESKAGVIYMSLGSHVPAAEVFKEFGIFMSVFKELPQKVLLKSDSEYPGEVPPNVKISKWFPQQDILAHNNCVLFITHGGLLSTTEATYHGVPLIGVPIFSDQPKNIMFAESQGFGRMLKFRNISRETVSWTIQEVLSNSRYKEEAARRSKRFKDRRHTPAEEAVYWIEHSLKYPFALTPKATTLSAIQLHMIDIIIFIVTVLIAIIVIFLKIIKCTLKKVLPNKNKNRLKKQ